MGFCDTHFFLVTLHCANWFEMIGSIRRSPICLYLNHITFIQSSVPSLPCFARSFPSITLLLDGDDKSVHHHLAFLNHIASTLLCEYYMYSILKELQAGEVTPEGILNSAIVASR